ncbi:MAG: MerR family transcriptional regulator [Bacteroidia bacterium]
MQVRYSIKDLERLSGIKAHTLRIWEQRYNILRPERTATNIRWYSQDDLKRLLNISVLNNHGLKISKIASLNDDLIASEVVKISETVLEENEHITSLVISMVDFDELRFEKVINNCILRYGFEHAVEEIVYPFFRKIGVMWQTGSITPVQEHFISNLVRQKFITAIDQAIPRKNDAPKRFVLFLADGELHELSLLFYYYKLKIRGHKVIYLGQSVPFDDLQKVFESAKPECMLSVFTHEMKEISSTEYIQKLHKVFSDSTIFVSGWQMMNQRINFPHGIIRFDNPSDLHRYID